MKSFLTLILFAVVAFSFNVTAAQADVYEVTVSNLTRGQIFSPVFAYTHDGSQRLFTLGKAASAGLSALAQDADTSGLDVQLSSSPAVHEIVAGTGAILPGQTETLTINSRGYKRFITVASMLVTTNDAFMAVNQVRLPQRYSSFNVPAYDAGAEDNDESCAYIPGPPCENPHSASAVAGEGFVHIHAGIHGTGDLSASVYDWRNPVAKISIRKVKKHYR